MYCPKCPYKTEMVEDYKYSKDWFDNFYGAYMDTYTQRFECPICGTKVETSTPVAITIGEADS